MKILAKVALVALTLLLIAEYIPGITVDGLYPAIIAAVVLGLLNVIVRPILIILTLPITILTLGLFILVINAGLFLFASSFIYGFSVSGFLPALVGSLLVSLVSSVANRYL